MDSSIIISTLESAFSSLSTKENIQLNDIKIGVSIRPINDKENKLLFELYNGQDKIRELDISTEILGLKKTKTQLAAMNSMGKIMYDLGNKTQNTESILAMGIYNKCTALNYDIFQSTFFVSKHNDKFISKLVFGDKIKELTMQEILSMEGIFG